MSKFRADVAQIPDGWEIVAEAEVAGVIDEDIRALGRENELTVRSHPWLPAGAVIVVGPGMPGFRDDAEGSGA